MAFQWMTEKFWKSANVYNKWNFSGSVTDSSELQCRNWVTCPQKKPQTQETSEWRLRLSRRQRVKQMLFLFLFFFSYLIDTPRESFAKPK